MKTEQQIETKNMKKTLSTYEVADILKQDDNANWSHAGSLALAEFLEEMEEATGEEMELDVVAIRCDFSEYDSLIEWAECYWGTVNKVCQASKHFGWDTETDEEEKEESIREHIEDHGILIEFDGGIIVSSF